jgi:transcriptional regulator with XRE-family HTH domain
LHGFGEPVSNRPCIRISIQIIQIRSGKMMNFPAAIRDARTSSGLSQTELAARANVSLHAVWDAERGNGTVAVLAAIISALELRFAGLPKAGTFGERVKALRLRRGWTQEKLAGRAGVSVMALSRLERSNARIATLSAVLAVLAPQARVRKPNMTSSGDGSSDEWFTPEAFMLKVSRVIGEVDLDPCAHPDSPVAAGRFYFKDDNGLALPWAANTVYVNPPYSRCAEFLCRARKAWDTGESRVILMLLPVRVHQHVFYQEVVGNADVFFLRGKITFHRPGPPLHPAPFGSMLVIFGATPSMIERVLETF